MTRSTAACLRNVIGIVLLVALGSRVAFAQQVGPLGPVTAALGTVVTPLSSRPTQNGAGRVPHTNTRQFVPNNPALVQPQGSTGVYFETPASLACVYRRIPRSDRCSPSTATATAIGGSRVIAIVDAYDHPNIVVDLATYSQKFGLPSANISVVFSSGTRPAQDPSGGWEVEEALDVELAHALAPYARIILVEAPTASDLYSAVDVASRLVAQAGGGEVSMSWGSSEFAGETDYDTHFKTPGVVYFAASGDDPGTLYPASSAFVVAVGGTTIARNATNGDFLGEATWSDGGGGPSAYVPMPRYQNAVSYISGAMRATPDLAADANPYSGAYIYSDIINDPANTGWLIYGGTSAATPIVAAIANATDTFRPSSFGQLINLYAAAGAPGFRPILRGICGPGGQLRSDRDLEPLRRPRKSAAAAAVLTEAGLPHGGLNKPKRRPSRLVRRLRSQRNYCAAE